MITTHGSQTMHAQHEAKAPCIVRIRPGKIPKYPLQSDSLASKYEYAVSRIMDMDRHLIDEAANKGDVSDFGLCELCSEIAGPLGKKVEERDNLGLSKKVYVYPFKQASVTLRICTGSKDKDGRHCTISIHKTTDKKQLEELEQGSQHGTCPRENGTGMLIAIRHPGVNAGENVNIELIEVCMVKMFQDSGFAQKFVEARASKNC